MLLSRSMCRRCRRQAGARNSTIAVLISLRNVVDADFVDGAMRDVGNPKFRIDLRTCGASVHSTVDSSAMVLSKRFQVARDLPPQQLP